MEWSELLDSIVEKFTDHHDQQVLNGWIHDRSVDGTVAQQGTRVYQDHEGADFGLAGKRFEDSNRFTNKKLRGVWDVSADPWKLTGDRMPLINFDIPKDTATDTPNKNGTIWNYLNGLGGSMDFKFENDGMWPLPRDTSSK